MSFDWSEYLNLAWELSGKPKKRANQEAKQRSAISRAYYAAFRKARNYLRDKEGYVVRGVDNTHRDVIDKFLYDLSDLRKQEIGKKLDALRLERNRADYDDWYSDTGIVVKIVLPLAEKAIKEINSL